MATRQLLLILWCGLTQLLYSSHHTLNPLLHSGVESEYPSYIGLNGYGMCLRAQKTLPAGTIVGTARMVSTSQQYVHNHPDIRHRHVSILGFRTQKPIYGYVVGKYAFCNHACNPNCVLTPDFYIKTMYPIAQHQELTVPYDAYLPHIPWQDTWTFSCLCTHWKCKKLIDQYRTDIFHPATYNVR